MSNDIRVPSTTVEIIHILGQILRQNLEFEVWRTECWTLKDIASWNEEYDDHGCPGRYIQLYYVQGHCYEDRPSRAEKLEIRASCEYDDCVVGSLKSWTVKFWVQREDGTIRKYYFFCTKYGYGGSWDVDDFEDKPFEDNPPARIAFKVKEESLAS